MRYLFKSRSLTFFAIAAFIVGGFFVVTPPNAFAETTATASDFFAGAITAENVGSALANGPETINTGATQSAVTDGVITVTGAIRAKNSNVGTFDGSAAGPAIAQYLLIPAGSVTVEEFRIVNGVPSSLGSAAINTDPTNPDRGWFDYTKGVFRMGVYLYSGDALKTGDLPLEFVFKDAGGTVLKDINYTLRFQTTVAINQYTLTFNSTDGTAVSAITQDFGTSVIAPAAPTKAGYTFNGWSPTVPTTMPLGGDTLTAQWTVNSYTLTFDSAGGTTVAPIVQNYGTSVIAPAAPTKLGYTFNAWSPVVPETMGLDQTLTAQWTVNSYTLTFDSAGGTTVAPIIQNYETAVTDPVAPTKEGYTFNGWSPVVPETMGLDQTLTAQWTVNDYTLTFDSAGGTAVSAINQNFGTSVIAPAAPTKVGYTFNGWSPAFPTTMPLSEILTATWTANQVNHGGGGGGGSISYCSDVTYGEYGSCFNGIQYRNVLTQTPNFCTLSVKQQLDRSKPCATPATPAVSGIKPATPATPAKPITRKEVLGAKVYADGTLLRGSNNKIYVVKGDALVYVPNLKELAKYKGQILKVDDATISSFAKTAVLGVKKYADGTLLKAKGDVKIYFIKDGKKVHIKSLAELKQYKGKTLTVEASELNNY